MPNYNPKLTGGEYAFLIVCLIILIGTYVAEKTHSKAATVKNDNSIILGKNGHSNKVETSSDNLSASDESLIDKYNSNYLVIRTNMKKLIQQRMNDPNSYEFSGMGLTGWDAQTRLITVIIEYRGKNAYGGIITQYMEGWIDKEGNVTKIVDPDK